MHPITRLVPLCALTLLLACGEEKPTVDQQYQVDREARTVERYEAALQLFTRASTALEPDKPALFRQFLALYPDSEYAEEAHYKLVFVLGRLGEWKEALEASKIYGARHPRDIDVMGAYSLVLRGHENLPAGEKVMDDREIVSAMGTWVEDALANVDEFPKQLHGPLHAYSGRFLLNKAGVQPELKGELYERAATLYAQSAGMDWTDRAHEECEVHFKLGQIRALQGDPERARTHFETALELRQRTNAGWPEDEILKQLEALGLPTDN